MLKKLRGKASDSTWFLSGNESKPTEPRCYRKSVKAYLKQATVRQVRPHALRHTFAIMQMNLKRMLHLNGIKRTLNLFLINHVFVGTKPLVCNMKRKLLRGIGCPVGDGTTIVGPIECKGTIAIGNNCWIGKNCKVNGNGTVQIGDNCDLGPEVTFQTGGHAIGDRTRRAGEGEIYHQVIGNGTWIGGRSTICNNSTVGNGCVVAACACVVHDVPDNTLVGGVPAKVIRSLEV